MLFSRREPNRIEWDGWGAEELVGFAYDRSKKAERRQNETQDI
jgi:hypothetical protein